ncbi:MAG: DUF1273 family protein [Clostridia bacterium]|nr:DUF1273 family protein [Clostridia bacterium]
MKICCIIGHRKFKKTTELELKIRKTIINLIEKEQVSEFLFGSKSEFTDFCYNIITDISNRYSNIKRIFIRAEHPIISNEYCNYLKTFYDDTYFYNKQLISNKYSYVKRNQYMIDKSDICIFYYDKKYNPKTKTQSGTSIAYKYATKKLKQIINLHKD